MEVKLIDVSPLEYRGNVAAYLIITDKHTILVETGPARSYAKLLEFLADEGISVKDLDIAVVTHVHLEHAGAASFLGRENPNLKIYVHPRAYQHLIKPAKLWAYSKRVFKEIADLYGRPHPVQSRSVAVVSDYESIDVDEDDMVFIHTPGHTLTHLVVYLREHRYAFTGDAACLFYSNIIIPSTPTPYDAQKSFESMSKLLRHPVKKVFFTHYSSYEPGDRIIKVCLEKTRKWYEKIKELYEESDSPAKILDALLSTDVETRAANEYFRRRGYGLDELLINVEGVVNYLKRRTEKGERAPY